MIWILITIAIITIIVITIVVNNRKEENRKKVAAEKKQLLKDNSSAIKSQWALCVNKYYGVRDLSPCIVHIVEREDIKVAVRMEKSEQRYLEELFLVKQEQCEDESFIWSGRHHITGAYGLIKISNIEENYKDKFPNAKCELCIYKEYEGIKTASFYIVLDYFSQDDCENALYSC